MNSELLLRDEVYKIVGCAIEVLNGLGHGLHEKPYENALVVELDCVAFPWPNSRDIRSPTKA